MEPAPRSPGRDGLHEAAAANDVETLRGHLAAGVPVDRTDAGRCTPLHTAVRAGALDAAGVLVQAGADVGFRGRRELLTPLHMAVLFWRASPDGAMIALLRGYDADPAARDVHGLTAADLGERHAGLPPALAAMLR